MKAKNFCLIVFAILAMAVIFSACGEMGTIPPPPPPPPPPEKTYTLQVQYIRTFLNPKFNVQTIVLALYDLSLNRLSTGLYATDDSSYHFNGELKGVKVRADYYFDCCDAGRYDDSDASSTMVGDIFIVTVKETGFVKELKDIRPYTLSTNAHPGPKAKAAFLTLTEDGTIISNAQSSNQ
ncbi:MAG: hypothetical protein Q8O30_12775 [Candidatus Omnitrophota bacterium]|nr:hypothetical protein [Candidatus Omnitrophota bacterium]